MMTGGLLGDGRQAFVTAVRDLVGHWYYVVLFFLLQAVFLGLFLQVYPDGRLSMLSQSVFVGLAVFMEFLTVVVIADPANEEGWLHHARSMAVYILYAGVVGGVFAVAGWVFRVPDTGSYLSSGTVGSGMMPEPLWMTMLETLGSASVYWTTTFVFFFGFWGFFSTAKGESISTSLRTTATMAFWTPGRTLLAILGFLLLSFLPMIAVGYAFGVLNIPVYTLMGAELPVSVPALIAATSIGGFTGLRFASLLHTSAGG
jgi:hypothetical protein